MAALDDLYDLSLKHLTKSARILQN